jgi:iron complex outermembrane receptor protein
MKVPLGHKKPLPQGVHAFCGESVIKETCIMQSLRHKIPVAALLAALATASTGLLAQDPSSSTQEAATVESRKPFPKDDKVEKMQVTGSRLKRTDVEGAVPVKILEAKDFERAGVESLSDLFRNQSENTFGSFNGGAGFISVGQATVNLKGLGSGRTLILVNGRRLPAEASLGGTNINNIPLAMVDRVEILKMSASAVYGADAVAGVINVILKKGVTGSEFTARASTTEQGGGETRRVDAVTGFHVGDTAVTVAVGSRTQQPIFTRDRDELWQLKGNFAYSAFANPQGTYTWGLVNPARPSDTKGDFNYRPSANCPAENQIAFPNDPSTVMCRGLRRDASTAQLTVEVNDWFVTGNTDTEFPGGSRLTTTLLLSDTQTASAEINRLSTSDPVSGADYRILLKDAPQEIRNQVTGLGLTTDETTQVRILSGALNASVLGNVQTRDQARGGMLGLQGSITQNWDWHVDMSGFQTFRRRYYNRVDDKLALKENMFAFDGSTPKFNLFNPDTQLAQSFYQNLYGKEVNGMYAATAYVNGDLGLLPAGAVSVATGVNVQRETYELVADSKDKEFFGQTPRFWGSMNSDGRGEREITSAFVEMGVPLLERLEWGVAGRFDNYSDFGGTFNYGTSLTYAPMQALKFRSNLGTSFKAPELSLLYNKSDGGYLGVRDLKYCDLAKGKDNPCGDGRETYNTYVNNPGNEDLEEETALAYNFGMIVQPFDFVSMTADYWNVKIRGVHSTEDLSELIEKEIRGESTGNSKIIRVSDANAGDFGRIARIENTYFNLGELRSAGVDLNLAWAWNMVGLKWSADTGYSHVISRKEKETADAPEKENVGSYNVPRWRSNNSIGVASLNHAFSIDSLTTGRMESSRFGADPTYGYIKPWTRFDASYTWSHPWKGTLGVGVSNISNKIGGLHETDRLRGNVSYPSSLSDAIGRSYFVTLKQRM